MNASAVTIPSLVIVGRPNVGKSALFNRVMQRRISIVHEQPGVTRDRVTAVSDWCGKYFRLVDTGGLNVFRGGHKADGFFDEMIREQLEEAVGDADFIIFVVDVISGLVPLDREVAGWLRQLGKPVVVAANKADNDKIAIGAGEFAETGFTDIYPISCLHGRGVGELLDHATADFAMNEAELDEAPAINIALVGRPNVGKSSTVNRLLGENRVIVSEVPGTTRDAVDIPFEIELHGVRVKANLIDTAGIKKRTKTSSPVEFFSLARARTAIRRADIVLVLIDATEPGTTQDKRICRLVLDEGKPCVLLANKWDLAGAEVKQKDLFERIAWEMPFLDYAPILTCCAVSGYNFSEILPAVIAIHEQMSIDISTPLVNRVVQDLVARVSPPSGGSTRLKIYYGTYKSQRPPTFILFVNDVKSCRGNYVAFLKNQFRRAFGLDGVPIFIEFRERRRGEFHNAPGKKRGKSIPSK